MKITKIELQNYRAFYKKETLELDGKNILIYGENGSGKTSLFRALEDFFKSANQKFSNEKINFQKHNKNNEDTPEICIFFEGIETPFVFSQKKEENNQSLEPTNQPFVFTNTIHVPSVPSFLADTGKQNPFFTYKRILRTFLFNKEEENKVGKILFKLLIEEILQNYDLEVNTKKKKLGEVWQILKIDTKKPKIKPQNKFQIWQTIFNSSISELLKDLSEKSKEFLQNYFKHNIEIIFTLKNEFDIKSKNQAREQIDKAEILTEVEFFGEKIDKHYDFLNEARLSALAICLYLASLKIIPPPQDLKILVLDDIFIGMDMSNRLPLLKILKEEFSDYQIIMTTYDRYWFNVAKDWFDVHQKNNWKNYEMYVDDFTFNFDVPVILPTKSNIEKAEDYIAKHDYPACGMFLRKDCEKILNYLLKPEFYKKEVNEKIIPITTEPKKLNAMITTFKFFCENENINYTQFEDLGVYKDAVLNPLSHNDITSHIYKQELLTIIDILKKIEKIKIKEIPNTKNETPLFEIIIGQNKYSAAIKISDNLMIIKENEEQRLLNACKVMLKTTRENEIETPHNQHFDSLQKVHKFLCDYFRITYNSNDILDNLKFRNITLKTKIENINII